jgi:hypothetical protein
LNYLLVKDVLKQDYFLNFPPANQSLTVMLFNNHCVGKLIVTVLFFLLAIQGFSQQTAITQNIRGVVIDQDTKVPLIGATVELLSIPDYKGVVTNGAGNFILEDVPVGRHTLRFRYLGYKETLRSDVLLSSGKELFLRVELEERVEQLDEVVIKSYTEKERPINEMALVGARSFTVEETERFAGSLGDVARLVSNYAGVTSQNDSRNDIIIRGNSPMGLLWRLDGIAIPNPNHFGQLGTTGGPIGMLNNNLLANSDFYTGAFPAEFSNALAGAFDLRMRSGNSQKREYVAQVGLNGFEAGVEGPFLKGKSASYLANYRYSTLALMHDIGLPTGTGDAIPYYQDLSFKLDLPTDNIGNFSLFGIMGKSNIDFQPSREPESTENNTYSSAEQSTDYGSDLITTGLTHKYYFNKKTSLRTTLSSQISSSGVDIDRYQFYWQQEDAGNYTLENEFSFPAVDNTYREWKTTLASHLKYKTNAKNIIQAGFYYDHYNLSYQEIVDTAHYDSNDSTHTVKRFKTLDQEEMLQLYRIYGQWLHKFTDDVSMNLGLNYMHLGYNQTKVLEPRASLRWKFAQKHAFSLGYGWHSQLPPRMLYFVRSNDEKSNTIIKTNKNLDFIYSQHYVAGYDYLPAPHWRIKLETYYQDLSNVPVEQQTSNYSVLNEGVNFFISLMDSLENTGTGENYGAELTIEKFLSNNYYMLLTGSLFESTYTGSNNLAHNTIFNTNFVVNMLGGYEFEIGNSNRITLDIRTVWGGGKRYTPVHDNWQELEARDEDIYNRDKSYSRQSKDYFRLDFRIGFKQNNKNFSQEWALDLGNLTQHKNVFDVYFDTDTGQYDRVYQQNVAAFMALYRINF